MRIVINSIDRTLTVTGPHSQASVALADLALEWENVATVLSTFRVDAYDWRVLGRQAVATQTEREYHEAMLPIWGRRDREDDGWIDAEDA